MLETHKETLAERLSRWLYGAALRLAGFGIPIRGGPAPIFAYALPHGLGLLGIQDRDLYEFKVALRI